ncbi:MAG: DUF4190 domain-containing protein [Microbacterium sp.]
MSGNSIPPYPSGPQPAPPVYAPGAYAAPRPNSGLALTSFICGLSGLVLVWLVAPLVASIVAVITGHMALKQLKSNLALGGRGLAITGLITGYIGVGIIVAGFLLTVLTLVFMGSFSLES